MNLLIPNSDSLPLPADNVREAFPPAKPKKKAAPPSNDEEPEPVEDEDEDVDEEFEDDEDEELEPIEDEEEDEEEQSATVKVTVTAAPDRPAKPAKAPAPPPAKKVAPPPPPPGKKKSKRPARGFAEAEMDAVVEAYIRPLREYTTKSGKHVEIHSEKWHSCVEKVKARGDVDNAYAVCTASLGAAKSLKKGHGGRA